MIVVTGVLKEEIVGVFRDLLPLLENGELVGRNYSRGIIGGNEVTTIYGFIGKVESALMTQAIIDHFHPKYIIHCGSAGAIDPNLEVGDIICGTTYYEHDFQDSRPAGFQASSTLVEKIKDIYPYIKLGCIVSGDVLISNKNLKMCIYEKYQALAADMDSAAMAKVCFENNVGFCSLKVIVDTSEEQTQLEYEQNFRKFASLPSAIVSEMLDKHLL
ncbi:MAG TPA: 5'-methylthioadenosine/S-adenosylhomocysteine nucleosidase [Fervidobacterium sp.]|jgi:adenosylhomocysteine nucleosidase|nr:5'-methylthioadenosine/S-adenosylhomocysteine nucleosidase [Fervidobacterium sp.]HPT58200.1 5'-methylthioadenosine/S-adenosylhomocysteine nucleosidase [Fervidobacterium sp.]